MKVMKFGAIWCMECVIMKPIWAEIEKEISGFEAVYYDADDNPEMLEKYGIKDIPVFIFLDKEGVEFLRLKGIQNRENLLKIIKENIDK